MPAEVREFEARWGPWITAFMLSVNPLSGAITQLPIAGGPFDQPARAVDIWLLLQSVFVECMPKDSAGRMLGGG